MGELKDIPRLLQRTAKGVVNALKSSHKGDFDWHRGDITNIEYLYYVNTKKIDEIQKDGYIPDFDITESENQPSALYCFDEFPSKYKVEKTLSFIREEMSVIIIEFDRNEMNSIYKRRFDDGVMVQLFKDKLYLKNINYRIEVLDWQLGY